MKKIAYSPANTTLHALHPFTKLALLVGFSIMAFHIDLPYRMILFALFIFIIFLFIRQNPFEFRGMRVTLLTTLMIGLIQCLFNHQGATILNIGSLRISDYGIQRGIIISGRFLAIILCSYLFILTTAPSDFAYAFMQIGVPYRYAFMIITSMRLVPILAIEGERIFYAQKLRGAKYSFRALRKSFFHLSIFLSAVLYALVNRINRLAISMEGRSFGRYPSRTYQKPIKVTSYDGIVVLLVLVLVWTFYYLSSKGNL